MINNRGHFNKIAILFTILMIKRVYNAWSFGSERLLSCYFKFLTTFLTEQIII